jgi:hypothetical protein
MVARPAGARSRSRRPRRRPQDAAFLKQFISIEIGIEVKEDLRRKGLTRGGALIRITHLQDKDLPMLLRMLRHIRHHTYDYTY